LELFRVLIKVMGVPDFIYFKRRKSLSKILALMLLILSASALAQAHPPSADVVKMFPLDLRGFHTDPLSMRPLVTLAKEGLLQADYFASDANQTNASPLLGAAAEYLTENGNRLLVEIVRLRSDSEAYSFLTVTARKMREEERSQNMRLGNVGTASFIGPRSIVFFCDTTFARITNETAGNSDEVVALGHLLAETFGKGEDDVPVLVKHLPDWQATQPTAIYAVNVGPLRDAIPDQPILSELNFEGGTEAVSANYGQSQLVIVEFTTPQISIDNDQRILAKIQELKNQGQSAPSAYRRVGNYSVFVFNASDEKTANELIDQVKYQQVVQWLGEDPHLYEKLQRYFANTSAGVLLAVMESSGLSLLVCLGLGALLGGLLFRHRRAQQSASYSDAGGTVRLNLDELTGTDSQKLLDSGTSPGSNSRAS